MPRVISAIRSGGQSGVDRGALDAARAAGVRIEGWCPAGGWAEDRILPPGILTDYPEFRETPLRDPAQRTEWNVRDSHVTVIVVPFHYGVHIRDMPERLPGTHLTIELASHYGRPVLTVVGQDIGDIFNWIRSQGSGLTMNIAGPREREAPGVYEVSRNLVDGLLKLNNSMSLG